MQPNQIFNNCLQNIIMDMKYNCPKCSGTFTKRYSLNKHLLIHSGVKQYSCSQCLETFTQKGEHARHMKSVHLKLKLHNCTFCSKKFSTSKELQLHFGTHERQKYTCKLCSDTFVQKGALLRHINSGKHAGKRPLF